MTSQEERDIVAELRDEYLVKARNAFDCQGCGLSANLAMEAADTIERQTAALRAAKSIFDSVNEFGKVVDGEAFDRAETAVRQALDPRP